MDATAPLWFDATLHPHRSLSRRGFLILMGALCLVSFAAGVTFVSMGAWPVFGFFGLDVLGLYWAFRLNYWAGSMIETIRLSNDALIVGRLSPKGIYTEWTFQPYWVRLEIEQAGPYDTRISLASHGRALEIGSFLSMDERLDLAAALKEALARLRAGQRPAAI